MSKKGNGEGTIVKRKDGKWQAAIWVTYPSGERKRKYFYAKTRKECADWLTTMRNSIMLGRVTLDSNTRLIDWLHQWLKAYCINIRDSTRMNYMTYLEHIQQHRIADIPLDKLTTNALQEFVLFLKENGKLDGSGGLSAKTIRNIFQMLHKALKQAVGNQYIWSNPVDYVELPKIPKKEMRCLSYAEQESLLDACHGERWEIGMILLLFTGIRIGELLALRRDSLQIENGIDYLNIRKSLQRVTDFSASGKAKTILRVSDPKTENSVRQVPLLPEVLSALQLHIARQEHAAAGSFGLYIDNPYFISNEIGEAIDPTTFRTWFKEMVEKAGLSGKITPHTLRHTFASTSLKDGMDLKSISTLLGHYSTDFTARTYVHTDLQSHYTAMGNLHATVQRLLKKEA